MSATMLSPKSIPDVTPPAVITLPSLTIRAFSYVAPTSGSNSVNAQCVVARRPFSNPAAPRIKAPVHTEVTYFAEVDFLRINSIVSRSPIARTTPVLPPGTQIKSSRGQFSKVCVGTRLRPLSLGTGDPDFAMMCIADRGNRAKTCCGPVKSSCVNSGKMTDVKDRHCLAPLVLKRTTLPVGQRDPKAKGLPQERRKNRCRPMSALGQKQTSQHVQSMSALPPKSGHGSARP